MKFNKVLNESMIKDKGIKIDTLNGNSEITFFYDITNSEGIELKKEIKECILGGPYYGNEIRFIADSINKKFIIFRPNCLHYKAAVELGYKYPKNKDVLFGNGTVNLSTMKLTDVEFSALEEMPRNKESNNFFEKLLENKKWKWTEKYGDIEKSLFELKVKYGK